jgi:hypothetical protein
MRQRRMSMNTITVKADPDASDCLSKAASELVQEYPDLRGYDLDPQWADDEREYVSLTVPEWFSAETRKVARG